MEPQSSTADAPRFQSKKLRDAVRIKPYLTAEHLELLMLMKTHYRGIMGGGFPSDSVVIRRALEIAAGNLLEALQDTSGAKAKAEREALIYSRAGVLSVTPAQLSVSLGGRESA